MSNLTAFNQDGIEIYINNTTGESFASISGYARMSGIAKSTVHNRLKGCSETDLKTAEVLTRSGLQGVRLINEKLIAEWLLKDNPDMATKLLTLGIRVFLHQLAGYEVKSSVIEHQIPTTYKDALKALLAAEEEKERLQQEAELLLEENEQLTDFKEEVSEYEQFLELLDITKNEVSDYDYCNGVSAFEYLINLNNDNSDEEYVDPQDWNTIAKRASQYYRMLEGRNPDKNSKNRNIFKGKKVAYIIATIKLVKSGI